jgi:hypothetical protein
MNYNEFEKIMVALKGSLERLDILTNATDRDLFLDIMGPLVDQIIDLLEHIFHDEECSWVSYWMFELDFGEKYVPGMVQITGQNVPLKTIKDLWNILDVQ